MNEDILEDMLEDEIEDMLEDEIEDGMTIIEVARAIDFLKCYGMDAATINDLIQYIATGIHTTAA